jgi:capsular polysaccharide biosynthesis protein
VNDNDQAVLPSLNKGNGQPRRVWADDDATPGEDGIADLNAGLTSLGFIRAALRHSLRFWGSMAVAGFLIGAAVYVASPPTYQASTTLFLTVGPESVPGTAIQNDQAIVQSRAVAGLVVHKLRLPESVSGFLGSYAATPVTDRVLRITVNAPSGDEAVSRANWLAKEFLGYRAEQLKIQQNLFFSGLDQQVTQAQQQLDAINGRISQLRAQHQLPKQQAELSSLRTQQNQAANTLSALQNSIYSAKASTRELTTQEVNNSQVLDAAAAIRPPSRLKHMLLYAAIGLVAGLALSLAIVVIRALISDRLRRRDDVAQALGAPVRLSVGTVRLSRWLPGKHGLAAAQDTNIRRIVACLGRAVPTHARGAPALAIVPVDGLQVAALSLVSLAVSCARQGQQVVVADLAKGAPAAGLLGSKQPGIRSVRVDDTDLLVAVPEREDATPIGPLDRAPAQGQYSRFTEEVVAACASADLVLTLAPLDPSLGGEHLRTWATDAVVMVTAGRSSWTKIHAAGEMIGLAGTRLISAVLIGADKTDESLGVTSAREAENVDRGVHPDESDFFVAAERGVGGAVRDYRDPRHVRGEGSDL